MGDPEQDRVGSVLLGRYRIEGLLGRGGMSTVYRGMQLSVQRPVAIKLIAGSIASDPECVQRFRREAEAMARLQHPSSVRIFEFGVTEDKELFIVMELLDGQDLAEQLHARGALPLTEALGIAHQVLEALCEAHALGIVHRDLKPANIFLSQLPRAQVLVKVMDFGIAGIEQAADDTKITRSGVVMGTPTYLSPEQALGKPVDARSDLYSLGVSLFEMLVGQPPFTAEATAALLVAHVSTPPPRLAELRPDGGFSAELQQFVDALLAKSPEQRPASAEQALAQLERLLQHEQLGLGAYSRVRAPGAQLPTPISPPSHALPVFVNHTWPELVRRAQQHRALALAGGALLLAGTAWLSLSSSDRQPETASVVRPAAQPLAAGALAPGLHQVRIVTEPSGASVQLNGVELGVTPYALQFRGPTQLSLELAGYASEPLWVRADSEPNIAIELTPRRAVPAREAPPAEAPQGSGAELPVPVDRSATHPAEAVRDPVASGTDPRGERVAERAQAERGTTRASEGATRQVASTRAAATQPTAASARHFASSAALLAPPGRSRREALLEAGSPYPSLASARRARESGVLDAAAYRDVVWALRALRNRRIDAEKLSYRRGLITRVEYERRERQIELDFAGY